MEERDVLREENTLTISNLWTTAKKKILLILALVVALAAVGALYSFFLVPQEYTTTASLIVSVKPEKTVKTITGSDGKTYTIVDDSDLNAESAALSYACSIAYNSLAFFSDDNDVIYLNAMKQYKSGSENAADVKIKSVKKSLTVSNQSSQIFLSYKSTLKDPEKMLGCIIDSFLGKVNEKNSEGKPVFESFADRITVLSQPYLNESKGKLGQVAKYAMVFALLGVVISFCIVVIATSKNLKPQVLNKDEQKAE